MTCCYNCNDRYPCCWSSCERYTEFRNELRERRMVESKQKMCDTYTMEQKISNMCYGGRGVRSPLREARRREDDRMKTACKVKRVTTGGISR